MNTTQVQRLLGSKKKHTFRGGSLSNVLGHEDVVIKAYCGSHDRGYSKLRNEVAFINSLPAPVRKFYPEIIDVIDTPGLFAYTMPYYSDMKDLSDEMLSGTDEAYVWKRLSEIIKFMETTHYPLAASKHTATSNLVNDMIHDRLEQSITSLEEIHELKEILDGGMVVDGLKLLPMREIQKKLLTDVFTNSDLINRDTLVSFHGNFHLANILVGKDTFKLIDPRGDTVGARVYDTCKLFVHLLIRYDEIHTDRFTIEQRGKNIDIRLTDKPVGKRYDFLQKKYLDYLFQGGDKSHCLQSLYIMGGAHAVSFSSYHARKEDVSLDRVKAFLIAGMCLLTRYVTENELDLAQPLYKYQKSGVK